MGRYSLSTGHVITEVSEVRIAFILDCLTLKITALRPFETSVTGNQPTRRNVPLDFDLDKTFVSASNPAGIQMSPVTAPSPRLCIHFWL
jgi:hypothetical protein